MERSSKADCWGPARDAETGKGSRQLLAVDGLFCGGCARGLEQRLRKLEGVLDAGVHYLTASAFVHWNPRLDWGSAPATGMDFFHPVVRSSRQTRKY